jgi:hypothetical protein
MVRENIEGFEIEQGLNGVILRQGVIVMKKVRKMLFNIAWWVCDVAYQQKMNWVIWWQEVMYDLFGVPYHTIGIPDDLWKGELKEVAKQQKLSRYQLFILLIRKGLEVSKALNNPQAKLILQEKISASEIKETEIVLS